jgi:hypothetical protein
MELEIEAGCRVGRGTWSLSSSSGMLMEAIEA